VGYDTVPSSAIWLQILLLLTAALDRFEIRCSLRIDAQA
jgi:hypothetical protein